MVACLVLVLVIEDDGLCNGTIALTARVIANEADRVISVLTAIKKCVGVLAGIL